MDIIITGAIVLPFLLVGWVALLGFLKYAKLVRYERYSLLHLQFDLMIASYLVYTVLVMLTLGLSPTEEMLAGLFYPPPLVLCVAWFYAVSGTLVAYGSFLEPWLLKVRRLRFRAGDWPQPNASAAAGDRPVRVVLMSDFHASAYNNIEKFRRWVEAANKQEADLMILLGDFLEGRLMDEEVMEAVRVLKELKAEKGVLAIPGNHDYDKHAPFEKGRKDILERLAVELAPQVRFIINEAMEFEVRGRELRVAGMDDAWGGEPDAALARARGKGLNLVAVHNPDALDKLGEIENTLLVCGHTHGGQIRLPLVGQVIKQPDTKYGRRYGYGFFELAGNSRLLVTSGLGALGTRARLFCRPEVVVLEIY